MDVAQGRPPGLVGAVRRPVAVCAGPCAAGLGGRVGLTGAHLRGADLTDADLHGANLTRSRGYTPSPSS
ncbi:pentapeptide repeat-containing protein [Streptomyces sp. NPDC047453]|uniref:pentapeptide repeat-containing protein n=1 Tax=Streptomyces sp. NPDC047453 TaxID=3154812 RepID=UPI0033E5C395